MWNRIIVLVLGCGLLFSQRAAAAVIQAISTDQVAVLAAVTLAKDGDTVTIPAGTSSWTIPLQITKAITLQGSGIGNTIILDSIPDGLNPFSVIRWTLVPNKVSRMTGIEFRAGTRTVMHSFGAIAVVGSKTDGRRMRIDHCKFDSLRTFHILTYGALGVYDHNNFIMNGTGICVYTFGENYGDGEWATPNDYGSDKYLFIEDNTFYHPTSSAGFDGFHGCKFVVRNNTITNLSIEVHGTESGQRYRGSRAIEVYNNRFYGRPNANYYVNLRSGGAVIYSNSATANSGVGIFHLTNHRNFYPFKPWGGADGVNPWDVNDGRAYSTNTATSAGTRTVTVKGMKWAVNQWAGYTVRKIVPFKATSGGMRAVTVSGANWTNGQWRTFSVYKGGATTLVSALLEQASVSANTADTLSLDKFDAGVDMTGGGDFVLSRAAEILSNTADTITFADCAGYAGGDLWFAPGDYFEINKVSSGMDQPGRSGGGLVSGDIPKIPAGWNNQVNDPCYEWNNFLNSGNINFSAAVRTIRSGEHFVNDTVRPGYAPYIYPHPLTLGVTEPVPTPPTKPSPPSQLNVVQ